MYMLSKCCGPRPPDCFGCYPTHARPETIQIESSGFDWGVPEDQTDVEAPLFNRYVSGQPAESTTTHHTRSRNPSGLNGRKELRAKPDGSCQWLWSDIRAISTVIRDGFGNFDPHLEETVYEPLNATDSSNPWDRVFTTPTDSRCGSSFWQCLSGNGSGYGVTAQLIPVRLTITNPSLGYFTVGEPGPWHWLLTISATIGRSAINYYLGVVPEQPYYTVNSALVARVTPINYVMQSAYDFSVLDSGASSLPPYRYGLDGFFPNCGGMLHYVKEIDCSNDFSGEPFNLAYMAREATYPNRVAAFDVTYPESVQVTI